MLETYADAWEKQAVIFPEGGNPLNGFASSNLPLVRTPQDRAVYIVEAIAGVECDLAVGRGGQCPQPGPSVFPERHPRHSGLGYRDRDSGTAAAADYPQELTLSINEVVKGAHDLR